MSGHEIIKFTGDIIPNPNHKTLEAHFTSPAGLPANAPKTQAFDIDAVQGQIDALKTYNENPDKKPLPEGHYEGQMSEYQKALAALTP